MPNRPPRPPKTYTADCPACPASGCTETYWVPVATPCIQGAIASPQCALCGRALVKRETQESPK